MLQKIKFHWKGLAPLLLHNGQLSDPLNKWAQLINGLSSKRKRSERQEEEMAKYEWYGSLYLDDNETTIIIPGQNVEGALRDAAKLSKKGKIARASIFCQQETKLVFSPNGKDVLALWKGGKHSFRTPVRVKGSRIQRTRPFFANWELHPVIEFNDSFDPKAIVELAIEAGKMIGIGDWRPRFGRFEVVSPTL